MDFMANGFDVQTLTLAINKTNYQPQVLANLGVFQEIPVQTTSVQIEELQGTLNLVDVAPRSAPGKIISLDKRQMRSFVAPHLPEQGSLLADEVQNVRAFGSAGLMAIEQLRDRLLTKMRTNIDITIENHRLQAVMGNYVDSTGTARSLFTEFGVTQQTINFDLGNANSNILDKCMTLKENVEAALDGTPFSGITVICSPSFFRALVNHPKVKEFFLNYPAAQTLATMDVTSQFQFGGMTFLRYRGTSLTAITADQAYAIPTGAGDLFSTFFAPANYMETVNTLGLPYYAKAEPMPLNKGIYIEAQSNPLNICTRPAAIVKLTAAA